MNNYIIFIYIFSLLMLSVSVKGYDIPDEIEEIKAPFEMPKLKKPTFPNLSMDITIKEPSKIN